MGILLTQKEFEEVERLCEWDNDYNPILKKQCEKFLTQSRLS